MAAVGAASVWAVATGDKGASGPSWQVPKRHPLPGVNLTVLIAQELDAWEAGGVR